MDFWGEGDREGEIERGTHGEICVTSCPQPYLPRVQLPSLIYQESSCPAMQSKLSSFCIRKGSASSLESAAPASRAEREHRAEVECMRLGLQWPEPALSKKSAGRPTSSTSRWLSTMPFAFGSGARWRVWSHWLLRVGGGQAWTSTSLQTRPSTKRFVWLESRQQMAMVGLRMRLCGDGFVMSL